MHPTRYDDPSGARAAQIAGLYREHARWLERRVACRACADPQTIEDACSFAWARLLTRPAVDLDRPQQLVLGWLTVTATREVWRLEGRRARERPYDHGAIEGLLRARDQLAASTDTIVADRDRLALVAQLPRRPRRFVLRLAMGYSHREIAADEHATATTTNKQITRAKRLLRTAADDSLPRPDRSSPSIAERIAA
jgi:DNA-directed RNA polymerase specialized sigma24 family protein